MLEGSCWVSVLGRRGAAESTQYCDIVDAVHTDPGGLGECWRAWGMLAPDVAREMMNRVVCLRSLGGSYPISDACTIPA